MEIFLFVCYIALAYFVFKTWDGRRRARLIKNYESKYILITGCDTGFGHALAKMLDKLGCHVFAGCLTEKGEDELRKLCSERLVTIALDVASHESVERSYRILCKKLPAGKGLWSIVNNAGISGNTSPMEFLSLSDYQQVLEVNTLGMVDVTTTFLPLVKKECGRIVNMTSMAGRVAPQGMGLYCVSKYAAEAFSDSLRRQMKGFKVSVHIIEPGYFKTNIVNAERHETLLRETFEAAPKKLQDEYGKEFLEKSLMLVRNQANNADENIELVLEAYKLAMFSKYPKVRYVVGKDAEYLFRPISMLPTTIGDFLLQIILPKAKLIPKACRS